MGLHARAMVAGAAMLIVAAAAPADVGHRTLGSHAYAAYGTQLLPAHEKMPVAYHRLRRTTGALNRETIRDMYIASEAAIVAAQPNQWTGDIARCDAGNIATGYRAATVGRINLYRQLAGLATVDELSELSALNQQGALIGSANNALSHTPAASASCYSADGYNSTVHSNIAIGNTGPDAVDAYIDDSGASNAPVGHRRWLLYPPLLLVGTGDTGNSAWRSSSDGIKGNNVMIQCPSCHVDGRPSPAFVAWPPPGFTPSQLFPSSRRWSIAIPDATFTGSTVTIDGTPATIIDRPTGGAMAGDATLVFEGPDGATATPVEDTAYSVVVTVGGDVVHSYTVTAFDAVGLSEPCANITFSVPNDPRIAIINGLRFTAVDGALQDDRVFYEADVPAAYLGHDVLGGSTQLYLYHASQWWWVGPAVGELSGQMSVGDDAIRPQDISTPWRSPDENGQWVSNPDITFVGTDCAALQSGGGGGGGGDGSSSDGMGDGAVAAIVLLSLLLVLVVLALVIVRRRRKREAAKKKDNAAAARRVTGTVHLRKADADEADGEGPATAPDAAKTTVVANPAHSGPSMAHSGPSMAHSGPSMA